MAERAVCFNWATSWPHAVHNIWLIRSTDVRSEVTCSACLHALGSQQQEPHAAPTPERGDVSSEPDLAEATGYRDTETGQLVDDPAAWHEHDASGCLECPCVSAPMNSAPCTCPTAEQQRGDVSSEPTAEGLTEAMDAAAHEVTRDFIVEALSWAETTKDGRLGNEMAEALLSAHEERILADRLAAVQAEGEVLRVSRDRARHQRERMVESRDAMAGKAREQRARAEAAEAERDDLRAALDRVKALDFAAVLRAHLPRDRYRDDGEAIGTYCTCGEWTGHYFADGEAGPFDDHLAAALRAAVEDGQS